MESRVGGITVVGGGNTAFALAANLALQGHRVTLCEHPEFRRAVDAIMGSAEIQLTGEGQLGTARLEQVTTEFGQAIPVNDLVLVAVPAYAHLAIAKACGEHLRPGQTVVLLPGTLGSFEFARTLKFESSSEVTLAEADTSPYVCRKTGPAQAHIWGIVPRIGIGVFPATRTDAVMELLAPLFPNARRYSNALECGLSSLNPLVHPAGVLMNAGRIEYSRGDFYFYEEGVTPSVAKVIATIDRERLAIGTALGLSLAPAAEAFANAGFGPRGDLWATINGSKMLTQLRAPGTLDTRWLSEDVPFGLVSWVSLGEELGLASPAMRAIVQLCSIVLEADPWKVGRTAADLGLAGLDAGEMVRVAGHGFGSRADARANAPG
jgi:opine dehydrogenase